MTGRCYLCGKYGPLETHHIFYGPYRKKSDKLGLTVQLCHYCHNEPPDGVHFNKEIDLIIKRYGQRKAMWEQGWTFEEFIEEFGRNYL